MNAQDLMIGDWVKSRGKIEQVREVYEGYICTDSFVDSHDYHFDPIPLTAEILEKNGFKKCEGNEWSFYKKEEEKGLYNILWSADELYLEIASYTSLTGEFNRMGIKYTHELQHALRLCGIGKEIEL